jgi:hypothetical protein
MSGISPQQKQGSSKKTGRKRKEKKGEQGMKRKRGETSVEELHVSKREEKENEIYKMLGEILLKERPHFPIVQNPMCGLIHTHISFALVLPSGP